ncbi:MAG: hypothetical protein LBP68_07830 [Acidobacteriota bacterium]|jgi:hypothetical protein|nr:hypothetical protein [Acidobacteriota bacterium]
MPFPIQPTSPATATRLSVYLARGDEQLNMILRAVAGNKKFRLASLVNLIFSETVAHVDLSPVASIMKSNRTARKQARQVGMKAAREVAANV